MIERTMQFLKEVRAELQKVNWPTRKETIHYTLAVIAGSVALSLFLGGLDFLFTYLLNRFVL